MNNKKKIKFIDFCAWIWWWRSAAESLWYECIWYSEIDKWAIEWYNILYWSEKNYWDLMQIDITTLPNFDLMIAWFPCQTFSIAWLRKGLNDERGQIIFWLLEILKKKNVKYFLFENVKWLISIDNWKTLKNIILELEKLWYNVNYNILNTKDFWLPHSRERVYIYWEKWYKWKKLNNEISSIEFSNIFIKDFLIDEEISFEFNMSSLGWNTFIKYLNNKTNKWKIILSELLNEEYLIIDTRQSDLRLYRWYIPTLRKGRHWLLYVRNWKLRKISWFEWMLLQWFNKEKALLISKELSSSKVLWLVWNAMSVNVIKNQLDIFIK
jgi:DNA (cytosine-5)-methyltransferase 1